MDENKKSPEQKDAWDKLGGLSTFLSTVVIATVALIVNSTLDLRQQRREDVAKQEQQRLAEEQHQLARVQTLSSFMPHLSGSPESRDTAIYAIQALGYTDLATRLAQYTNSQKAGDTIMRTALASASVQPVGGDANVQPVEGSQTVGVAPPPPPSKETEIGWAYVGDYSANKWNTRYLDFPESENWKALALKIFKVRPETGALYVRPQMPDENGQFFKPVSVLRSGTSVKILEVRQWSTTGYTWARISLAP